MDEENSPRGLGTKDQRRRRTEETKGQGHRRDIGESTDPEIASKVADGVIWNNGGGQGPKRSVPLGEREQKRSKVPPRWREQRCLHGGERDKQDQSPNRRTKSKVDDGEKLGQVREEELDE